MTWKQLAVGRDIWVYVTPLQRTGNSISLLNTHLESLVHDRCEGDDWARGLHHINGTAGEPGPLELRKEVFPDYERAHACREAEHLVEADGHGIHWRVGEREDGCWCERSGVEQGAVAL